MKYVNNAVDKIDGLNIALGKPAYVDDFAPMDSLIIKILRSQHAFAKITSIDVKRAKALEGVECVLTYEDVPKTRFTLAGQSAPEASPYDHLILEEYVRYVGDEVAIVAAKDEKTAEKALSLIKVKYEVFEPVLDFETASEHKSIVHGQYDVHFNGKFGQDVSKNIVCSMNSEVGNVAEEFEKCDVVVDGTYYMQAQAHAMMETFRAYAYMDYNGRLVVVASTQVPFHNRRQIARALEIPQSKVRVIKPRIGGGFGGKQTGCVEMFPAIVTWITGKPSKIIYTRNETFTCSTSRHATRVDVKVGSDKEGNIKAIEMKALTDTGAYGDHAFTVFGAIGKKSITLYNKVNAVKFSGKSVYTNKSQGGALRGFGATQGTFALECVLNKLADKLNIDACELRKKNLIQEGEKPKIFEFDELGSSTLNKCIDTGKKMIGWDEKYPRKQISPSKIRAVGMAVTRQGSGVANIDSANAEIKLDDNGSYTLLLGATDIGTGSDTILTQMAAEVLNTPMSNIGIISSDTDATPFDPGAYASSTTYVTGTAVVKAAEEILEKITERAAMLLGVSKENVDFDGATARDITSDKSISLAEIGCKSLAGPEKGQLVGLGSFGSKISPPPFMSGFAEVEVDIETGKVDLIDYVGVVDCGTIINKNLVTIQTEGGIVQGIGLALYEDVKYNSKGKLNTNTFMQYKIPCRKDIKSVRVAFEESYEPSGPFGAKSIGEVVINTPPPAIANAIYNAVGVEINTLPITPEKVLKAIKNKAK